MIELHTEEGTKLEIYDISCIARMREIYGGLKGEYTSLTLSGLPCSVTVLETKRQIERILKAKRELFKETADDTDQLYKYSNKEVFVVATKGDRVTVIDQNKKKIDIAETIKVKSGRFRAGILVELEEHFFIKAVGRGRYWE